MADVDLDSINDEEELSKLLRKTDDMATRKKIREKMKEIRQKEAEEMEKRRKERETNQEDSVQMRLRQAEAAKLKKMREFDEMAKAPKAAPKEDLVQQKHREAEERKQKAVEKLQQDAVELTSGFNYQASDVLKKKGLDDPNKIVTTKTETTEDGGAKTTTTTTTEKSEDGGVSVTKQTRTTTKTSGFGGTAYGVPKRAGADETAKSIANTLSENAGPDTTGSVTVRTVSWSSKGDNIKRQEKTKTWGAKKTGPRGARAAFQALDKAAAPAGGAPKPSFMSAVPLSSIRRNAQTIKQEILFFCQANTREYENVEIKNFSGSWANGLAFCALIHHFRPDSFDYSALDPKNRRHNFQLAFDTAEREADVAQLLDVDDMVMMKTPDWKCVFTQVQMYYRRFRMDEMNKQKEEAGES